MQLFEIYVRTKMYERIGCVGPLSLLQSFLLLYVSTSQVSSASSPSPPVQTGTSLPLNAFSWKSSAPDIIRVVAVNNRTRMLFGRSRGPRHTKTGATAVESAASMHPVDEVIMLLGGGCLWPSTR